MFPPLIAHTMKDFNPRSHEGSDDVIRQIIVDDNIFQSTLPRGERRCSSCALSAHPRISIHAPTRGATYSGVSLPEISYLFQSTLPRGERRRLTSIGRPHSLFQSTLPRGERRIGLPAATVRVLFQSTLPRGERLIYGRQYYHSSNFNPRSHEGSDSNFRQKVLFSLSKNCLKYLILTTNYFN